MVTGVTFSDRPEMIGNSKVWVSSHLFKLVHDPARGRTWAHWHENNEHTKPGPPITYEQLVERTGIEFLPKAQTVR